MLVKHEPLYLSSTLRYQLLSVIFRMFRFAKAVYPMNYTGTDLLNTDEHEIRKMNDDGMLTFTVYSISRD